MVEYLRHLLEGVYTFLESCGSASLLGKFTFTIDGCRAANDRHTSDNCRDISLGDVLIVIEIIDIEYKLHLLVELGTVNAQKTSYKLF